MANAQRVMDGSMMLIPDEDEGDENFGSGGLMFLLRFSLAMLLRFLTISASFI